MNVLSINRDLSSDLPSFKAKSVYYRELKNIPNLTCACCGKKTINQSKIGEVFIAISKPLSTMLKKGYFKTQENVAPVWNKLMDMVLKYPKDSLDKILANPTDSKGLRKAIEKDLKEYHKDWDSKELNQNALNRYKSLLNLGRAELRSSSVVMKRLAAFKEYMDGEKLATFEQLEIYAKKYPRKTIGEILRMEDVYNFHKTKDLLLRAETREKLDFHYSNILDMVKKVNPEAEEAFIELKTKSLELVGMSSSNERVYVLKKMYLEELEKYGCGKLKDKVFAEIEQMPATFVTKDSFLVYAVNHNYTDAAIIESLLNPYAASFEHIKPKYEQGANDINNGIVMCRRCNRVRERESYVEFIKYNPRMPYNAQKQIMQIADYILDGRLGAEYDFYPINVAKTLEEYSEGMIKPDISGYCKRRTRKLKPELEKYDEKIQGIKQKIDENKAEREELLKRLAELEESTKSLKEEKNNVVRKQVHDKALSCQLKEYLAKNTVK